MPKRLADVIEEFLRANYETSAERPDLIREDAEELERRLQKEYVLLPQQLQGKK